MDAVEPCWWTLPRAARHLGVGTRAVETLVARGEVTSRKVPGSYVRVLASDVRKVAERYTSPASSA